MADEKREHTNDESKKNDTFKNDPETLNTTDPQEHMEGPFSSLMQSAEKKAASNDKKDAKGE